MTVNRKIFLTTLSLTLILLTSCKKFLEEPPDTHYAYPTSTSNLQAMLDDSHAMNEFKTPSSTEASSDDFFVTDAVYNSLYQPDIFTYIWNASFPISFNDWATLYGPVYAANVALEQIDKISPLQSEIQQWNNVKGSALFYKAYYFLHLLWTFSKAYDVSTAVSDLGIVLRHTTDINKPSFRASVKDSYLQVIDNARLAILYLPEKAVHPLRPSKAAAYGLLARTYLSIRNYDSAFKYANLSLSISNELINYNGDNDIVNSFNTDFSPFKKYNKETIFYTTESGTHTICSPTYASIDTLLYNEYDSNDLRKSAFFLGDGTKHFKGSYSQNSYLLFSGIASDEMLLTRAECFARLGNTDSAANDLNRLLENRYKSGTFIHVTGMPEVILQRILLERRKELIMRNLRWIDIKRLNKEGANIILLRKIESKTYMLQPNDNRYALPLPIDIIQMTGIPQNPT